MTSIQHELKRAANPKKAKLLAGFFKTGRGQYAEGDIFIGIMIPQLREIAKKYEGLVFQEIKKILSSPIHEERLAALFILVERFRKSDGNEKKRIYDFYLAHLSFVNNWDLVDASAHQIAGEYLKLVGTPSVRLQWVKSQNLWLRRIAIVSTFSDIRRGDCEWALKISEKLLGDTEDLLHKAVGWMLREVGKQCSERDLENFLRKHVANMPRTALRYAIERFPEEKRKSYLSFKRVKTPKNKI